MFNHQSSVPPPPPSRDSPTRRRSGEQPALEEPVAASPDFPRALVVDGRYRVKCELGRGGMGVVYLAKDTWLGRPVALKVLEPRWSHDSRAVASFLHEAQVLAFVHSANIVQVYTFGVHDESYFFAMEYVRGRVLGAIIDDHRARGAPMSPRAALAVLDPVARGLAVVHAAGIVHRDVKPSNIILEDGSLRPVLVDFGVAGADHEGTSRVLIVGTPRYMAPEQAVGGAAVTARSDIYALGCTAFELLTGRRAFDADDLDELRWAHLYCAPPAVSSLRPDLAPFDAVLARALAKAPDNRFESCDAFANALAEAAKEATAGDESSVQPRSDVRGPPSPSPSAGPPAGA